MARTTDLLKDETFTFRLDPALKTSLTRVAAKVHKQPAELVRQLVRNHVAKVERREFEAEARRQSRIIAEAAKDPNSDEAQVMRELDAIVESDGFGDPWPA
jgi:predicted transcriptional regulator